MEGETNPEVEKSLMAEPENQYVINGDSTQTPVDIPYKSTDNQDLYQENQVIYNNKDRDKKGHFQPGNGIGHGGARKNSGRKPKTMHDRLIELESDITKNTRKTMERLMEIIQSGQTKEAIAASELLLKYSIPIPQDPKPANPSAVTINNNTVVMGQQSEAQKLLESRKKERLKLEQSASPVIEVKSEDSGSKS